MSVGFGSQAMRFETRGVGHPRGKSTGTVIAVRVCPAFLATTLFPPRIILCKPRLDFSLPPPLANNTTSETLIPTVFFSHLHGCWQMAYLPSGATESKRSSMPVHASLIQRTANVKMRPPSIPTRAQRNLRRSVRAEQKTRGPGCYGDMSATVPYANKRVHVGISHSGPRFSSPPGALITPGPNHYCPEVATDRPSTCLGVMSGPGRDAIVTAARDVARGSGVAPGEYTLVAPMSVRSSTGKRGPYDCYTGPRLATAPPTAAASLGPGMYTPSMIAVAPGTLDFSKSPPRFRCNTAPTTTTSVLEQSSYARPSTPKLRMHPPNAPFGTSCARMVYSFRLGANPGDAPPGRPTHSVCANQYAVCEPLSKSKDWPGEHFSVLSR